MALLAATGLLLINFWAWSLISPLATAYRHELSVSPFMLSVLVAAPVLVGSLGRIPLGLLTDRFGGKRMFVAVSWLSAAAVASLQAADSTNSLLMAALALGIAGASFAVGVPFVNAWFPKRQRGLALGVYALGNAGTAISGLLTPRLSDSIGRSSTFWLVAGILIAAGAAMYVYGQDSPSWHPAKGGAWGRFAAALKWDLTWKLSLLYGLTFGAFVAFGLYLPVLLNQSYGLAPADAAARAAGFVLLATFVRPVGGWLSDRLSGLVILRLVFTVLCVLATFSALKPALAPLGTIAYLGMAAALGIGNGAIFAVVGHRCEERLSGTVTGIVGAAGGIGGYFPPLIMGISYQLFHSYSAALAALAIASLVIALSLRRLFGYKRSY
jgi:NNP family nitrate/nitrite transporter-like MFS transporter